VCGVELRTSEYCVKSKRQLKSDCRNAEADVIKLMMMMKGKRYREDDLDVFISFRTLHCVQC